MRSLTRAACLLVLLMSAMQASLHAQATTGAPSPGGARTVLVTGSTDGLGREVALRVAAEGAHVIVHGRNRERGAEVVAEITRRGKGSAAFVAADLASLDAVRAFGDSLLRQYDRIDVIVNNAGIWLNQPGERRLSADGHEMHFAVNYLAGYVLTRMLLPRVPDGGRIVNVASAAQSPIDFDDPMLTRRYSGMRGYAQSKLAQVLFTVDLAEELAPRGITVAALHPATLMDTPMVREAGARPQSTIDEGATAVMHLVSGAGIRSGGYYDGLDLSRAHDQAYDAHARAWLRGLSDALTVVR